MRVARLAAAVRPASCGAARRQEQCRAGCSAASDGSRRPRRRRPGEEEEGGGGALRGDAPPGQGSSDAPPPARLPRPAAPARLGGSKGRGTRETKRPQSKMSWQRLRADLREPSAGTVRREQAGITLTVRAHQAAVLSCKSITEARLLCEP